MEGFMVNIYYHYLYSYMCFVVFQFAFQKFKIKICRNLILPDVLWG
jgi:hypothetical protein